MNWDFFFRQLSAGKNIDETCFSFCDDPDEKEHYLGFIPHCDEPYWIGYCDVEGGCAFKTAEELVSAPVFDGKSLRERWSGVMINGGPVLCCNKNVAPQATKPSFECAMITA